MLEHQKQQAEKKKKGEKCEKIKHQTSLLAFGVKRKPPATGTASQPPPAKKKAPPSASIKHSCEGVIPTPKMFQKHLLCTTLCTNTTHFKFDIHSMGDGTTDALLRLCSKECTDDGKAQGKTGHARCCQPCLDFRQSKWENTKKTPLKKNLKKFGALLDVLGRETLSVTDESTLKSITTTGDQHLSDQGQQLKQRCLATLSFLLKVRKVANAQKGKNIGSALVSVSKEADRSLAVGPNKFLTNFNELYRSNTAGMKNQLVVLLCEALDVKRKVVLNWFAGIQSVFA